MFGQSCLGLQSNAGYHDLSLYETCSRVGSMTDLTNTLIVWDIRHAPRRLCRGQIYSQVSGKTNIVALQAFATPGKKYYVMTGDFGKNI